MSTDAPARWWAAGTTAATARALETAADKRLYVEVGLAPVTCRSCGTDVLVKKNSNKHTSVQWTSDPVASCPEFAAHRGHGATPADEGVAGGGGTLTAQYLGCPRLKASIEDAAAAGELVVPDA
jgi:hypothetical protein